MRSRLIFILLLAAILQGTAALAGAEPAAELDARGLSHYGKAFYEAAPNQDATRAASEYGLAEEAFQEAIRKKPDWVEPDLHLGRTYFVQEKYRQAAEIYRQALTLAPQRKEIYLQLASTLEMAGDYEGAVGVLKDLRGRETDERARGMVDKFIEKLQSRGKNSPAR